jgi:CheY-like chemotaxis protein
VSHPKGGGEVAKKIAIVDNDEELRLLFAQVVSRLGYQVEFVARDGDELVDAVSKGSIHPDVILMDYRMARMNGLEAAAKVLRIAPKTQIILDTADDLVRRDATSAGLFFLLKPFPTVALVKTIEDALAKT